ncbi:Thymidylate kinase [subsurface metagenome]
MQGIFITFEGIDGSGKDTQAKLLAKYFKNKRYSVIRTREPGGTSIGEKIRKILLSPKISRVDQRAEVLLFAASRAQIVSNIIKPALEKGKIVISNRYVDSSYAYQGIARKMGLDWVIEINKWATQGLLPDITFFLDIPEELGLKRVDKSRNIRDKIEKDGEIFQKKVRKGYYKLAKLFPERYRVIDANRNEDLIQKDIRKEVDKFIRKISKK